MVDRNTGFVVALQTYVLYTLGVRTVLQSLVVPCPQPRMKGKRLLRNDLWMFQACVLGLSLQG
jgi:hypothetical protein